MQQEQTSVSSWLTPQDKGTIPFHRYMLRWTEHPNNNQDLFKKPLEIAKLLKNVLATQDKPNEYVFQLERGEHGQQLKYYQIYLKLGTKKDLLS